MILRIAEKTNVNGWRRQLVIDLENKTIKKGAFQFSTTGDINQLTHKQYLQFIEAFENLGFTATEV
jgi:Holliday junction resolvasome RuvABC DNA-binding subunit